VREVDKHAKREKKKKLFEREEAQKKKT